MLFCIHLKLYKALLLLHCTANTYLVLPTLSHFITFISYLHLIYLLPTGLCYQNYDNHYVAYSSQHFCCDEFSIFCLSECIFISPLYLKDVLQ